MKKTIAVWAVALATATGLSACSSSTPSNTTSTPAATTSTGAFVAPRDYDKGGKNNPVTVGIMGPEIQYDYLKSTAEAEGLFVSYTSFNDYNQPNPAVANGELDLNQFQHILFLANYNVQSGQPLVALQSTVIYPLGLYSKQYKTVADIPAGASITIPNDDTNQARALQLLSDQGLLTLKSGTDPIFATPLDIDAAASRVQVVPVSAEQTPRSLEDPGTSGAVINNTFALDANLNPNDALAQDDPSSPTAAPYVNIWAGRAGADSEPAIAEVLRIARTKEYQDALMKQSKNSAVVVDQTADELKTALADTEAQVRAHQG